MKVVALNGFALDILLGNFYVPQQQKITDLSKNIPFSLAIFSVTGVCVWDE